MVFTFGQMFWPHQYLTWKLSTTAFFGLSLLPERISKGIAVTIVCDRVVALTLPFRYKIVCRPMTINAIIVMVYVVITSLSIPDIVVFFIYHFTAEENRTIYTDMGQQYVDTEISQSPWRLIYIMFNFLVFDCLPILIVFVCNIIIIISLRNRNILTSTTSEVQKQRKLQELQLTKLLLTISILFFVLTCPSAINRILTVAGISLPYTISVPLVFDIHSTLSLANCSINFIVYAVMNTKYRDGYMAILCCCR